MKLLPRGIVILERLCLLLKDGNNSSLLKMLQDAKRFVLYSKTGIEATPLQIYASALIFSPETSLTKQNFSHEVPTMIKCCFGVEKFWSQLVQTIEANLAGISSEHVAFSPDGSLLASVSSDIRIWDTETLTLRKILGSYKNRYNCVVFSPNNRWIAAAPRNSFAQMWNLDVESDPQTLDGHTGVSYMAFSYTGDFLASISEDQDIRVWDMKRFPSHRTLRGQKYGRKMIVFAPNCNQLASFSSFDHTVRVWDTETGVQLHVLRHISHGNYQFKLRWESQLQHLTGSGLNTIQVWDTIGQKLLHSIDPINLSSYDISPEDRYMAAVLGNDRYNIRLWETSTIRENCLNMGANISNCKLSFSRDGSRLAIAYAGLIKLWDFDMAMSNSKDDLFAAHRSGIDLLLFSDDGKQLASLSKFDPNHSTIGLWKVNTGLSQWNLHKFHVPGTLGTARFPGGFPGVAFTPDGRCLLVKSREENTSDANIALRIWDTETGTLWHESNCGDIQLHSNSFSQDGSWIALPYENTIKLWNINSRTLFTIDPSSGMSLEKVHFSPNSHQIIATSGARIYLWDMKTPALQETGKEMNNIANICFSENGRWLELEDIKDPSTSRDGGRRNDVSKLSFSCDGFWFAVVFNDRTASVLDMRSGCTRSPFELKAISLIRFSPDRKTFASVSQNIIRLWNLKSRALLWEVSDSSIAVDMVRFSGDGTQIISTGLEGNTICCWEIENGKMQQEFEDYGHNWGERSYLPYLYRPNRHTNRGTFMLERPELWTPYSISKDISWITRNGRKFLWLPRDYRPQILDIQYNVLVMGYKSGRIVIIRFDEEYSEKETLAMMREGQGGVSEVTEGER